jgi:hypothetical protein
MYSKDDGYIYFTDIEEAKALYKEEDEALWEIENDIHGWRCEHGYTFCCSAKYYRRRLTPGFRIRKEFRDGDPVCWCGANGVLIKQNWGDYPILFVFGNEEFGFTADGKAKTWHKTPSLSHGHDSTVDNQKYPVERVSECKLNSVKKQSKADEVSVCIPHWQENLRLAIEGEKIDRSSRSCLLCVKYRGNKHLKDCTNCPIREDTGATLCIKTPYYKTASGKPEHVLEMLNYLIDLARRLRNDGK